ncbi:hypothetical protein [Paenibacillus turpanensis]|uniref:hypothetical protein n=1 Tax=Paenibacillus turpanensis TaxID=2689078 RepID=UPI00140B4E08|nr:hypothetical protein [Paenibacillus turpanensis]
MNPWLSLFIVFLLAVYLIWTGQSRKIKKYFVAGVSILSVLTALPFFAFLLGVIDALRE